MGGILDVGHDSMGAETGLKRAIPDNLFLIVWLPY
jgi:hypothetical protein